MSRFLQIGADVEEFVARGTDIISVQGLVSHGGYGTKNKPLVVQHGNLQEDNVLAEYAIDPAGSLEEFKRNIHEVRGAMQSTLFRAGASLRTQASHEYEIEFLQRCGKQAITMGCDPEFNAWEERSLNAPNPYQGLRTAGGHVHFSYEHPDHFSTVDIIRCMDYLLGMWSLQHDNDNRRRTMYGAAGACRIKDYGGEYRTLSNFWVASDELMDQVYSRTEFCVQKHEELLPALQEAVSPELLRACINTGNFSTRYNTSITSVVLEHGGFND